MPRFRTRNVLVSVVGAIALRCAFLALPEPVARAGARAERVPTARSGNARPGPKPARKSDKMEALPEQFLAFDVSRPFGDRRAAFSAARWKEFCKTALETGRKMVVVQARGSVTSSPYADQLLKGARAEGLHTAAYVFINFHRASPTGDVQIKRALAAAGSEAQYLQFMVIDVENGAAGDMTPAERVNRIGQAVEAVTMARLRPVIYAKNTGGRRGEWTDLTGNATDFSYLPLWVPRYDAVPSLDEDGFGNGWRPFGGWDTRHGKQFADDRLTAAPGGLDADESVFHRSVLKGPSKPRPYRVTPLVKVDVGAPKRDKKTGEVVQSVRLLNQSSSTIEGPISLVLDCLSQRSPMANETGTVRKTSSPYLQVPAQSLAPGASVRTELRFEKTSSAPPRYEPEVRAGSGDM